ncbi:hypothetical protein XHC_3653 [Xanthomonas hortorum pv. carotae str. M081]|nr:hypothetical protein XHC_3653 [Xanthomonas hortorum pv. carotae str. M081]
MPQVRPCRLLRGILCRVRSRDGERQGPVEMVGVPGRERCLLRGYPMAGSLIGSFRSEQIPAITNIHFNQLMVIDGD